MTNFKKCILNFTVLCMILMPLTTTVKAKGPGQGDTMNDLNITTLNFSDSDTVNSLIEKTVVYGSEIEGIDLKVVTAEETRDNLKKGTSSIIFRKNVSKTPEMKTAKAKIELMPVYVPARKANGDPVKLEYMGPDGTVLSTRDVAKPLVVVYADEVPGTGGAMDVFAAISRDEGNTWKRKNLSRSADRSSFTLANGSEYPGDVRKPQCKVKGNKILVSWTSKYARSGQPKYTLTEENPYYEDDIWGVRGPQRSFDYTELDFPEVGEIPFSCVWICRGIIDPETGDITWFKAERLTSGQRDAYQLMFNGATNAGFAITWQEDPKGLRPGEEAGPGEGWSGATTNHKTDIWYSYIKWDNFDKIDTNFVSGGESQDDEDEDMASRPKALVPCSLPVRISDNDTLNAENLMATKDANGEWVPKKDNEGKPLGSHRYGYMIEGLCDRFYEKTNNQSETKQVCVTADGRLLDGDTGASRPNIMLQPYQKSDGSYSAWAILCYEETKGVGSGPPETNTESVSNENSGEGQDSYYPDLGKNVIYHSFDFTNPDLVSAGTILNPQAKDAEGNLLYLVDENGDYLKDWNDENIPAYENARRPRFIIQSKKTALGNDEAGTVLVCLFKTGEEGKGRPSDIFMRRWVVGVDDKGNPYDPKYLTQDIQNISSVTPTETWENPDSQSDNREPIKVIRWKQTEENLNDFSWTNPYEDARAHRGFIKGKFLAVAYDWTPNWAAARNGNDIYNLYIRRSFDGGKTWTTDPNGSGVTHLDIFKTQETNENHEREEVVTLYGPGKFEPARNVSQLRNNKASVIEPRLVGVPGTILTDGKPLYPEDKQDPNAFWVTYGTESNPGKNNEEEVGCPLDIYYSYSTDRGETYYTISKTINPEGNSNYAGETVEVWDWLAKDSGNKVAEQAECQIRMTPDGSILYAVWNETGEEGGDVIFRRIMREEGSIEAILPTGIKLDPTNISLTIQGDNYGFTQLTATVEPENAYVKSIIWSSDNEEVAKVDANGLVTAVGAGDAIITARIEDTDYKAFCSVSVAIDGSPLETDTQIFEALSDGTQTEEFENKEDVYIVGKNLPISKYYVKVEAKGKDGALCDGTIEASDIDNEGYVMFNLYEVTKFELMYKNSNEYFVYMSTEPDFPKDKDKTLKTNFKIEKAVPTGNIIVTTTFVGGDRTDKSGVKCILGRVLYEGDEDKETTEQYIDYVNATTSNGYTDEVKAWGITDAEGKIEGLEIWDGSSEIEPGKWYTKEILKMGGYMLLQEPIDGYENNLDELNSMADDGSLLKEVHITRDVIETREVVNTYVGSSGDQ